MGLNAIVKSAGLIALTLYETTPVARAMRPPPDTTGLQQLNSAEVARELTSALLGRMVDVKV